MNPPMKNIALPPGTRVLVTGATGYTGSVLIRKLAAQGASIRAIARSSSNTEQFKDLNIEWIRGDVFDPTVVEKATKGIEVLFHVAAAYREAKITDETYNLVHLKSTMLLAEALVKESGFKRFVHVSTVGVHGHIEKPPADEEYPFNPGDIYQRTKAEAEVWIRGFSNRTALPLTVIRPAAIYGPGDRRLLKVFKMASRRVFPLFGRGRGLYHLIHVDDLTDVLILAAVATEALGEVFIAGNREPSELKSIAETISDELGGKPPRFIRLPAWPLFVAAVVCEVLCRPFKISPPLYRRRVAFFTKDRSFNTAKLERLLGYANRIEVEAGLRATARWYRDAGWL